jgi:hypothetical protein
VRSDPGREDGTPAGREPPRNTERVEGGDRKTVEHRDDDRHRRADQAAPGIDSTSPVARYLALSIALLAGALFAAVFLSRVPSAAAALAAVLQPAVSAVIVLLAAYAAGTAALALARAIFRRLAGLHDAAGGTGGATVGSGADRDAKETAAVLLVGLPAFGTAVALVAWSGSAIRLGAIALTLVLAAAGALLLARDPPRFGKLDGWDALLLGPPISIALIGALAPVNSPDELIYKLAVPKAYLLFGGMIDLPLNSHSYFSGALSLVSLAALALSGGIAAKLVHAVLFVAGLVILRRLGDRLAPGAGRWATTVLAWTPALMLIAGWAWSEWAVLALLMLSYLGWLDFHERATASAAALTVAALAGAAAIKYTALPWIVAFAVVASVRIARGGLGTADAPPTAASSRLGPLYGAAGASLVVLGGLFYLRNWLWSGSPVAPFLLSGAPTISNYRSQGSLSGWQEILLGYDIVHRGVVDDALGVLLPVCALLSPFGAMRFRSARELWWIGLLPLPFLVAAAPLSRLILTSAAPLAVVGALYLAVSWRSIASAIVRGAVAIAAGFALAMQLALVLWVVVTSYDPFDVLVGSETEAGYLERMRSYSRAYGWVAKNTPPDSRVLLLGENRSYPLERPTYSAGNFDGERMARFLGAHADAAALAATLRRMGVTHVIVHWPWVRVEGRSPGSLDMLEREYVLELPRRTALVLQELVDRLAVRRYHDDKYWVYELQPRREASPAGSAPPPAAATGSDASPQPSAE